MNLIEKLKTLVAHIEGLDTDSIKIEDKEMESKIDALTEAVKELKNNSSPVPTPSPTPSPTPAPTPSNSSSHPSDGSVNFLAGLKYSDLYVNQNSEIAQYIAANPNDQNLSLLEKIAIYPASNWLNGGTEEQIDAQVTKILNDANGKLVILTPYNIVNRDDGGPSHGGALTKEAYLSWIGAIDAALVRLGNPNVIFAFEPDAVGFASGSGDSTFKYDQYSTIQIAVSILTKNPGRSIYICLSMWQADPTSMEQAVEFLITQDKMIGIRGFCLNPSGFDTMENCKAFGEKICAAIPGLHYIIDSSRNGKGPGTSSGAQSWENPLNVGLGMAPLTDAPTDTYDGNVWIKLPGESDGPQPDGAPQAGGFYYDAAVSLAKNSIF